MTKGKLFGVVAFVALSASAFACGDDGGGGGGKSCGDDTLDCTAQQEKDFKSCLQSSCGDVYKSCFGSNVFQSESPTGGVCSDYIACVSACECEAEADQLSCFQSCGSPSAECQSCLTESYQCQQADCPSECAQADGSSGGDGSGGDGSGGDGSGSDGASGDACTDLQACCATITDATQKGYCQQLVDAGEPGCTAGLTGFMNAGLCN